MFRPIVSKTVRPFPLRPNNAVLKSSNLSQISNCISVGKHIASFFPIAPRNATSRFFSSKQLEVEDQDVDVDVELINYVNAEIQHEKEQLNDRLEEQNELKRILEQHGWMLSYTKTEAKIFKTEGEEEIMVTSDTTNLLDEFPGEQQQEEGQETSPEEEKYKNFEHQFDEFKVEIKRPNGTLVFDCGAIGGKLDIRTVRVTANDSDTASYTLLKLDDIGNDLFYDFLAVRGIGDNFCMDILEPTLTQAEDIAYTNWLSGLSKVLQ